MANEMVSEPGGKERNPRSERRQPISGGQSSRKEEKSGRVGGEEHVRQQSNADAEGPSQQTSTAQDELGQA